MSKEKETYVIAILKTKRKVFTKSDTTGIALKVENDFGSGGWIVVPANIVHDSAKVMKMVKELIDYPYDQMNTAGIRNGRVVE